MPYWRPIAELERHCKSSVNNPLDLIASFIAAQVTPFAS
jgi:hypothetical protein